jgi:hypothetical protein
MRAAPEASATTSTTTKHRHPPAPSRALAIVVLLLLSSLPAVAGELPAVERGWQKETGNLQAAFLDDTTIRFADADHHEAGILINNAPKVAKWMK